MHELYPPAFTLADVYFFLKDQRYDIVRQFTEEQRCALVATDPYRNEPAYQMARVWLTSDHSQAVYLVHANLGYMPFTSGDYLCQVRLDQPCFYFDVVCQGRTISRDDMVFSSRGNKEWQAQFDVVAIFDYVGLSGKQDMAPFVGFYSVSERSTHSE